MTERAPQLRPETATAALGHWLEQLVERAVVPGGVALVEGLGPGGARVTHFERAFGDAASEPTREPARLDTIYDCASLTKPLVTAATLLVLRQRGVVSFEAPATDWVPELRGRRGTRSPTVGELLTHSSGLPSWEPLYALAPGGLVQRARWLGEERAEPGRACEYGCPAYQVLGLLIERASGQPFADAARALWLDGSDEAWLPLPAALAGRAAPTERGNAREREMAGERAAGYAGFRDAVLRGETHDQCAFTLGGAAGNAGLFATARGAAGLALRFLGADGRLTSSDLVELERDQQPPGARGQRRTWGFLRARSEGSCASAALSDRAFGHVGFTGTSVHVDPDRSTVHVLLTNRIHPRWSEHPFQAERRRFHELTACVVDEALARE